MKVIGITGGVGAGKSMVLNYLKDKYNACIVLTDDVGRNLQKKGEPCYEALLAHFGNEVLDRDGNLDRAAFAKRIFSDREALAFTNSLIHPAVKAEIIKAIKAKRNEGLPYFFIESALLIEDHYEEICDELWFVHTDELTRKKRLKDQRGYDEEKSNSIIKQQLCDDEFMKNCDRVIENSGSFEQTMHQIDIMISELEETAD